MKEINGEALIDEDYLRKRWNVTDFQKYRANPNFEPPRMMPKKFPSLKVEEENQQATFKVNHLKRREKMDIGKLKGKL